MKKIEVSLIKRPMRISWQVFSQNICQFYGGALSYSLSHALRHLDSSLRTLGGVWNTLDLEKEGKRRARKCKLTSGSTTTSGFYRRYWVACIFSSLVLACMVDASWKILGTNIRRWANFPCFFPKKIFTNFHFFKNWFAQIL